VHVRFCAGGGQRWPSLPRQVKGIRSALRGQVYIRAVAHTFTSISYPLDRLNECEYFLARMVAASGPEFRFELNAFLAAARSVTFVLQKSLAHAPQFETWYENQREQMKGDSAMRFFLELRNLSQKHGPVSYIGGATPARRWSYRFVSVQASVPETLAGRDISECCAEHLKKLAALLLKYYREFPFHACIANALTEEGMAALGFTFRDVEACLGLPEGYMDIGQDKFSVTAKLHVLRGEVDAIDAANLERLADGKFETNGRPLSFQEGTGRDLVDDVARLIELDPDGSASASPRQLFLAAIVKRINDFEE
jgi:hypothetical protein